MIEPNKGIMIILISAILIICYYAPLTQVLENFGNVPIFNPQGSWKSPNTFNPGSDVEQWRINENLVEPGTIQELNIQSVKSQFPYNRYIPEFYNDDQIGLIKSDGVIVGGYMPQILRPFDSVTANPSKNSNCNWPCYSDKKFQEWCSEENAINYHGMRPLIAPNKWNENLRKMFKLMIDRKGSNKKYPKDVDYEKLDMAVFCTETQEALMSWLMQKVAVAVDKMPEMQKNGPWKSERFVNNDVQIYQYVNPDKSTFFKIIFMLTNPLRSVSSLVVATVIIVNGNPSLIDMDFVNEGSMDSYMAPQNGFGPITGHNVSSTFGSVGGGMDIVMPEHLGVPNSPEGQQMWEAAYMKNPNEFDWNYQNTLEVQKFNKNGFYSNVPGDNIEIEGGIPDSLKKILNDRSNNCKADNLMSCIVPGFTGITGVSAKALDQKKEKSPQTQVAKLNGSVKNVYANPILVYSNNEPLSLRGIETVSGTVYI
jgi:hypothetical protein